MNWQALLEKMNETEVEVWIMKTETEDWMELKAKNEWNESESNLINYWLNE